MNLLRVLCEAGGDVSIKELALRLALPPSTVHRLVHLLIDEGVVERAEGHRYRVGMELYRMSSLVVSRTQVEEIAQPFMRAVVDGSGEYCVLCLYLPNRRKIMVAETMRSSQPLGYVQNRHHLSELAWGATGRAVLAFLPEEEIRAVYETSPPSPADGRPLPPWGELAGDLALIRERGHARSAGQKIPGARGFAAPVFRADGSVLGSLCLTVPEMRFRPERADELGELITAQARAFSHALGYLDRPAGVRRGGGRP